MRASLRRVARPLTAAVMSAVPLAAALTAATPSSAGAAVTKVETTVDIRCAFTTLSQSADWYFPTGTPQGLIWLQHGFARANEHVTDLATKYAGAGYLVFAPTLPSANLLGCTLQNIGNNTDFLNNVADLFGKSASPGDKLGRSLAAARSKAGRPEVAMPSTMVFVGHSAGGEAAEYVAQRVHSAYPATWAGLRGLVLLDPVKSFIGDNTDASLDRLATTALPILTISSPPYLCNNDGSGTGALQSRLHRAFVGVRLTTGAHTDAEGASTDSVGTIACGTPQAKNVTALQTLAVGWTRDGFSGTRTAAYYPGGAYYQGLLTAGTIETLPGAS